MFIIIGIMLTGMLFGFLLRNKRLSWIHKIITLLIWVLLFLLGIDVGGNEAIIKGLHTLGLEARYPLRVLSSDSLRFYG